MPTKNSKVKDPTTPTDPLRKRSLPLLVCTDCIGSYRVKWTYFGVTGYEKRSKKVLVQPDPVVAVCAPFIDLPQVHPPASEDLKSPSASLTSQGIWILAVLCLPIWERYAATQVSWRHLSTPYALFQNEQLGSPADQKESYIYLKTAYSCPGRQVPLQ